MRFIGQWVRSKISDENRGNTIFTVSLISCLVLVGLYFITQCGTEIHLPSHSSSISALDDSQRVTFWSVAGWNGLYWLWFPVLGMWVLLSSILLFVPQILMMKDADDEKRMRTPLGFLLITLFCFELILSHFALRFVLLPALHVTFLLLMMLLLVSYEWFAARQLHVCPFGTKMNELMERYDRPALAVFVFVFILVLIKSQYMHLVPEVARSLRHHEVVRSEDLLVAGFTGFHFLLTSILVFSEARELQREVANSVVLSGPLGSAPSPNPVPAAAPNE